MIYIPLIIGLLTTGFCLSLSMRAYLRRGLEADLYLLLALILAAILFISFAISEVFDLHTLGVSLTLHLIELLALWAVLGSALRFRFRSIDGLIPRLVFLAFFLGVCLSASVFGFLITGPSAAITTHGVIGSQRLGIDSLDVFFEGLNIIQCLLIFFAFPKRSRFFALKIGFLIEGISDLMQTLNIVIYHQKDTNLLLLEWSLATLFYICVTLSIYLVYRSPDYADC